MRARYHRIVHAKRGCAERFERLMLAYAAIAHSECEDCRISVRRSSVHSGRFVVHEIFPNAAALKAVRKRSHFEQLWLPVIETMIEHVETYGESGARAAR